MPRPSAAERAEIRHATRRRGLWLPLQPSVSHTSEKIVVPRRPSSHHLDLANEFAPIVFVSFVHTRVSSQDMFVSSQETDESSQHSYECREETRKWCEETRV